MQFLTSRMDKSIKEDKELSEGISQTLHCVSSETTELCTPAGICRRKSDFIEKQGTTRRAWGGKSNYLSKTGEEW